MINCFALEHHRTIPVSVVRWVLTNRLLLINHGWKIPEVLHRTLELGDFLASHVSVTEGIYFLGVLQQLKGLTNKIVSKNQAILGAH